MEDNKQIKEVMTTPTLMLLRHFDGKRDTAKPADTVNLKIPPVADGIAKKDK